MYIYHTVYALHICIYTYMKVCTFGCISIFTSIFIHNYYIFDMNSKNRELKSTFEHIEVLAKLRDYFLRSNTSNINQHEASMIIHVYIQLYTYYIYMSLLTFYVP